MLILDSNMPARSGDQDACPNLLVFQLMCEVIWGLQLGSLSHTTPYLKGEGSFFPCKNPHLKDSLCHRWDINAFLKVLASFFGLIWLCEDWHVTSLPHAPWNRIPRLKSYLITCMAQIISYLIRKYGPELLGCGRFSSFRISYIHTHNVFWFD